MSASERLKGKRLFVDAARWGTVIDLREEERHYLVNVHRLGAGARVQIFDGQGRCAGAVLQRGEDGWYLQPTRLEVDGRSPPPVRLGLALTRGRKLDEVVRMVTEIGVRAIEPFYAERSVARPDRQEAAHRHRRWLKIAAEAARQSGQSWVPEIREPASFEDILARRGEALGLLLHPPAAERLSRWCRKSQAGGILLLIGPEGGFSNGESEQALRAGFVAVGLGLPVLQAGTAAVVAAAITCLDYYENLG